MDSGTPSTSQKALALNLDATTYGSFAEIGGGQEVSRWFFAVGGAAGTVAKTISAYDMAVSDGLYGPTKRYVSRERLVSMLEHEFDQLVTGLGDALGEKKRFFAFANTVATRGHRHPGKGRCWLGVRFQAQPHEAPSEIIVHAHLFDTTAARQQETLGVLGVNLIHGAFFRRSRPPDLISSLMDELSRERIELDMIRVSGPAFPGVDNRLLSLQLVEQGLTDAAMFRENGEVVQPSDALYRTPILVSRGSFRPVTKLMLDIVNRALEQFREEPSVCGQEPIVLAEMTLRSLIPEPTVGHADFLARADTLRAIGFDVLISRFEPYHELAEYLTTYPDSPIGLAVGLPALEEILNEKYYAELSGGILESIGRLFKRSVTMYVYPTMDSGSRQIRSVEQAVAAPPWNQMRDVLLELGRIQPVREYDLSLLSIHPPDVLDQLQNGEPSWEDKVPQPVAEIIKAERLFGWKSHQGKNG
jgi:hypothetical protein